MKVTVALLQSFLGKALQLTNFAEMFRALLPALEK